MTDEIFTKKLSAFLHDSPDKPFILMQGESHEQRAKELADKIGASITEESASDHIASAMERSFLPQNASKTKNLQVKFLENPYIKHPLSAKEFEKAGELKSNNKEIFKIAVEKAFSEIADKTYNKDDKEKFFYLWRNLLPLLIKHSGENIKNIWTLSPADTRIPDHSIFEHLKITSACCNSAYINKLLLNNCSIFLFTIGPVQSFIAQARKTQDLYWSSFILSYLNWKAIELVADKFGPDSIIFPDIYKQPFADWWLENKLKIIVENSNAKNIKIPTIPNRFLAFIPENDKTSLSVLGKEIEEKIKEEFKNIAEQVVKKLKLSKPNTFDKQIENFFQIYWIFVPWFRDENNKDDWENAIEKLSPYFSQNILNEQKKLLKFIKNSGEYRPNIGNVYSILFSFAEKALGARKNIREFEQLGEIGRKCFLCGERNELFYRDDKDKKYRNNDACKLNDQISFKYMAQGEGLCAVCFTKRCAEEYFKEIFGNDRVESNFPSTAGIAQTKLITAIKQVKEFEDFQKKLGVNYDVQLLYEENLTENYFNKYGIPKDNLESIKKLQKVILEEAKNKGIKQTEYYAVLMLDGDNMGKWLSGEMAPNFDKIYHPEVWKNLPENFKKELQGKKRQMTPAIHSAISTVLRNYSLEFVKKIIEEKNSGKLIYSGGDDVLAFVNLDNLLNVMVKLRAAFSGHIDKNFEVDFTKDVSGFVEFDNEIILTMGPKATASMGICVAHYKTPLAIVLDTARRMEKKAKKISGKNVFAISLLKHSGNIVETAFKWYGDKAVAKEGTVSILKRLVENFKNREFSDKFVYNLQEEFNRLVSEDNKTIDDLIIKTEIKRLLSRSCQMKSESEEGKKLKKQAIETLADSLYQIYIDSANFKNFISFLETAVFLARESVV